MNLFHHLQGKEGSPYQPLAPTQAPINPPYKTACELKKGASQLPPPVAPPQSSTIVASEGEKESNTHSGPDIELGSQLTPQTLCEDTSQSWQT